MVSLVLWCIELQKYDIWTSTAGILENVSLAHACLMYQWRPSLISAIIVPSISKTQSLIKSFWNDLGLKCNIFFVLRNWRKPTGTMFCVWYTEVMHSENCIVLSLVPKIFICCALKTAPLITRNIILKVYALHLFVQFWYAS